MALSPDIRDREFLKFIETSGGDTAVRVRIVEGSSEVVTSPNVRYVSSSAPVSGTRDGTFGSPFETLQDAIDYWGVPTTQAEYTARKIIVFLDGEDYVENVTFPTGIYSLLLDQATLTGDVLFEIDNAERFGSSSAPRLDIDKDVSNISVGITGDVTVALKSGGSAVSVLYLTLAGLIINGDVTISDGVNAGSSCASIPVTSMYRTTIFSGGTYKCRNAIVSLTQSNLASTSGSQEFGYLTNVQNTSILSTSVMEARSSTSIQTIRDLTLNSTGSVSWNSTGSVRNWNVDVPSANEVISKITTYPANTINLLKPNADALGYDNSTSGLSATDVQAAIDELDTALNAYLPLGGGTMTGDIDVNDNNLDNIDRIQIDRLRFAFEEAISTPYSIKNTAQVMVEAPYTSTGALTINLPTLASDTDEMTIWIKDTGQNAETNNITIVPDTGNGDTIEGVGSYVMDSDGQGIMINGNRTNQNWSVN